MPRLARKDLNTPFLHVMVQGVNKEYIFNKEKDMELYLKIIQDYYPDYDADILAYCLMSNHAHFAIYTENIQDLSELMHKINLKYAQIYNKENDRCGVLFRNRFKIEPIYSLKHLANCINYIHENPVKAKMVSKCEDYKYSSYNDYKLNRGIAKNKILEQLFGKDCSYLKMFEKPCGKMFMDIDRPSTSDFQEHIMNGICEFIEENKVKIYSIFEERSELKLLINYLKKECKIPYVAIRDYFEMSKGIMDGLKTPCF